jgi:hypothetical protein
VLSTGKLSRELYLKSIDYYRLNIFFNIRIFLKSRIWHYTHVCYNRCKFGCGQNVIKDTLLEKQHTFAIFSRLPLEWFSWKFKHWTPRQFASDFKFGSNIRGTLIEGTNTICGLCLVSVGGSFPNNWYLAFSALLLQNYGCWQSVSKGVLQEEKCNLSSFLCFRWSDFPYSSYRVIAYISDTNYVGHFRSAKNNSHIIWRATYLVGCVASSIRAISLKTRI